MNKILLNLKTLHALGHFFIWLGHQLIKIETETELESLFDIVDNKLTSIDEQHQEKGKSG